MDRAKLNFFVDLILFVSFLVVAVTGLIVFFFLPSNVKGGGLYTFLGFTKKMWKGVHSWAGLVMLATVIVHFVLHWDWIVGMTKRVFGKN